MVKTIVVLLVVFAYGASSLSIDTNEIKTKLEKVRDEAITSVDTLSLDNVEKRRAIVSHSSEFAHKVEDAVNKIFRIFVRVDERYSHRILPRVALHLNDVVHEVQEVLITKPTMLKRTLKESVRKVSGEAAKLNEVLQHFTVMKDKERLGHDVTSIVDKLIDAIHQLRVRSNHTHVVNIKNNQNLGGEIISTLFKIVWYDQNTYELLSKAAQNFEHNLGHILHHFRNEVFHFKNKECEDFNEILGNLQEIRSQLSVVLHRKDYTDFNRKVDDLKTQLRLTVHNAGVEMQKLASMIQTPAESRTVVMENSIRNIIADYLNTEQRVLWKLHEILRNHNVNTV